LAFDFLVFQIRPIPPEEADLYANWEYQGVEWDISFEKGDIKVVSGNEKLVQELYKIMLTSKNGNKYNPNYGSNFVLTISERYTPTLGQKMKMIVLETLLYLKGLQKTEQEKYGNLRGNEIIGDIEGIEVQTITGGVMVKCAIRTEFDERVFIPTLIKL